MNSRASKILALANLQNKANHQNIEIKHRHVVHGSSNHDLENNQQLASKGKLIDSTNIWSHYVSLEEMKNIENSTFEFSKSDLSQLTQDLSNNQLIQPVATYSEKPKDQPGLKQLPPTQSALTEIALSQPPLSLQSVSLQTVLEHSATLQPDLIEHSVVQTVPADFKIALSPQAPPKSTQVQESHNYTSTMEDLLCTEFECLPPSPDIFQNTTELAAQLAEMPFEDSDDSVRDKDYVPLTSLRRSSSDDIQSNTGEGPSKLKRKKKKTSLSQISAKKLKKNLDKYYMRQPCHNLCKKLCSINFVESQRLSIHADYWSMDWESRGVFLKGLVNTTECARTTKKASKRTVTHTYHLYNDGQKIEVCKTFFLATLGYDKKNDRHILSAIAKDISDQKDKRDGRNLKIAAIDKDLLTKHVMSFNPCVHHYRRAHAPNKKYLPSDLTIKMMHNDFLKQHPDIKCCFETYRNHVSNVMNISFTKLGHEECEMCEVFHLHNTNHVKERLDPDCDTCNSYANHKKKYTKARKQYDSDAKKVPKEGDVYVSADLQKVIMLPRLDSFKSAIFCPRLVAYNETFVPLKKYTASNSVYAVAWHEAISGRKQEDLVSAFRVFLLSRRDAVTITIWLDNCSAQNKNWCLLTFLIGIINSCDIAATNIVLKYFEPGHTFMSADSFHHKVEQSLLKSKVYDFQDFCQAIEKSNTGKTYVKQMVVSDFFIFKSHVSQQKLKDRSGNRIYLKDIVEVMVSRGKHFLYYKTDFDAEEYSQLNCLKSKKPPTPEMRCQPKGIPSARKQDIIKKLGPLMPQNRITFWRNIPVSTAEIDDAEEYFVCDNDDE